MLGQKFCRPRTNPLLQFETVDQPSRHLTSLPDIRWLQNKLEP